MQRPAYQNTHKADSRKIAEFLSKDGCCTEFFRSIHLSVALLKAGIENLQTVPLSNRRAETRSCPLPVGFIDLYSDAE